MFTRFSFSSVPFVLLSLMAADPGAPAGGGGKPDEPAKPEPEKKKEGEKEPGEYDPNNPPKAGEPRADLKPAVKANIFTRSVAIIKDKGELLAQVNAHVATIAARDKTILELTAENEGLRSQLAEVQRGMAELESAFGAKVETAAIAKSIDIAASQGAHPLPTKPDLAPAEDEVAALREKAANESDPIKRGQLHAKADRLADQKKNSDRN